MNHQNGTQYFSMAWESLRYPDIIQGLVKPLFFGYILGSIGCFYGMRTTGGTEGVGRSTIQAVVCASVLIIFVDFLSPTFCSPSFPHEPRRPLPRPTLPGIRRRCTPVVAFRNVSIAFDGPPVLEDVSFSVAPGETRVLLGPGRRGQERAAQARQRPAAPRRGQHPALRRGDLPHARGAALPLRARTGMVFQEGALFDSLTVRDNVAYQLIQEAVPDEEIDRRVHEALQLRRAWKRPSICFPPVFPAACGAAWPSPAPSSASRS